MTNVEHRLPISVRTLPLDAQTEAPFITQGPRRGCPVWLHSGDRVQNSYLPAGSNFAGAANTMQQVQQLLQQILSIIAQMFGSQQFFAHANASSLGDPHLSFDGSGQYGNQGAHFDSMRPHATLVDSDSFAGGYRVSTNTTPPQPNGVTYNERATVTTNFGNTSVFLDKDGTAGVIDNGRFTSLQNGQAINFGNGEVAMRNNDGSLTVTQTNTSGGSITTIMTQNGNGVDVNLQAQNVDLGGDLVAASTPPESRLPRWEAAADRPPSQFVQEPD